MGSHMSYPLAATAFCYQLPGKLTGSRDGDEQASGSDHYYLAHKPFWDKILQQRTNSNVAKRKFDEQSVAEYIRQYPEWNETDLITLRDQFLVFDQNEDGIIDYSELDQVLDKWGDTTDQSERVAYFAQIDNDDSDGVDFEEFLELAHNILTGSTDTASGFAKLYKERMAQKSACNRLSIAQQVAAGLV